MSPRNCVCGVMWWQTIVQTRTGKRTWMAETSFASTNKKGFFFPADKGFAIIVIFFCSMTTLDARICDIRLACNYCPTVNNAILDQQKKVEKFQLLAETFSLPSPFFADGFSAMRPSTIIIKQELRNEAILEFNLQHLLIHATRVANGKIIKRSS